MKNARQASWVSARSSCAPRDGSVSPRATLAARTPASSARLARSGGRERSRGRLGHARPRVLRGVGVEHLRVRLDDLGQRPVADPVAVGEAAPAHDPVRRRAGLEGREQLAHQPALADARLAVDRDEVRTALGDGAAVQRGEQLELPVAADERRAGRRERALGDRLLGQQLEGVQRLRLAAHGELAHRPEVEVARGPRGSLTDEHLPGRGGLLEPRGRVDRVARGERLAGARVDDGHHGAGVDPHPQLERHPEALLERRVDVP